jgi:hypothetical protein
MELGFCFPERASDKYLIHMMDLGKDGETMVLPAWRSSFVLGLRGGKRKGAHEPLSLTS